MLLCASPSARAAEYVVDQKAPGASDANPGTAQQPFQTIGAASKIAGAGDTVRVRAGTYREAIWPRNSGEKGRPLVYQAEGEVWVKGSDVVNGWEKEGDDWVKRPWRKHLYWDQNFADISKARFASSARQEQVFVNGAPLQWTPTPEQLQENGFFWAEKGDELRLRLPANVDPNRDLVEIPTRDFVVGAWSYDLPRGTAEARQLRAKSPERVPADLPQIDFVTIRGFHFAHNVATINRGGVRIEGDHWTLENNVVEWMNTIGILVGSDDAVLRGNVTRSNGQNGIGGSGAARVTLEDNASLWDNSRDFSTSWGGASLKFAQTDQWTVRRQIALGGGGSGIWFDIDCANTIIEDCVVISPRNGPQGGAHGGIFYEISYGDTRLQNNVVFGNHMGSGLSAYGAGITISSSMGVTASDNVILFCDGGISMLGGGRKSGDGAPGALFARYGLTAYEARQNTVQNNLVVGDLYSTLFVSDSSNAGKPLLASENNRFQNNAVLQSASGATTVWGTRKNASPAEVSSAFESPQKIASLGAEQARLNGAATRLVRALERVELLPDSKGAPVEVAQIWQFAGAKSVQAQGLWLRVGQTPLLLLDAPQSGEIALKTASTARVWNSETRAWNEAAPQNGALKLALPAGLTLVAGLEQAATPSLDARPAATQTEAAPPVEVAQRPFATELRADASQYAGAELTIDSKTQAVPELYDLASGVGWKGADDLRATARVGWDANQFRALIEVRDDVVAPAPANKGAFDGDAVEFFFDGRAQQLGASNYGEATPHFFVRAPQSDKLTVLPVETKSGAAIQAAGQRVAGGYRIEIALPWSALPGFSVRSGARLNFDFAVDDGDDPTGQKGRRTQLVWHGTARNFADPSGFGRLQLK